MTASAGPPQELARLISDYTRSAEAYLSPKYNELQAREEFIDSLFELLGWDITNKQRLAQSYKDVLLGKNIKLEGESRAPDYTFRIGGSPVFFGEAKKPRVDIETDPEPAYQLRRYAWSAKLPVSVLTNFRQLAVYDTRTRPKHTDKPSVSRILWIQLDDYPKEWTRLHDLISKDAIIRGSLERLEAQISAMKGTSSVDSEFLSDMERWRATLAKAIALKNTELDQASLNFVVQQTIDRIVFLRICEDRGIEPHGLLRMGLKRGRVYRSLFEIFETADEKYNSGLFHFSQAEKRVEPPDLLSPKIKIDDEALESILSSLYYPNSPYEFSVIPAEILGQVYEQFLGSVIRLTPSHRAIIEKKPEVKKAGGVFYTPDYVVKFVIKRTLDRALEGRAPEEMGELRIIDPACGSGSFLIAAYERLLSWHLDWYLSHPKQSESVIFEDDNGNKHLTVAERKRILQSCIFGVDIDRQAVEVTKLSLHLKVLEGETEQTLGPQMKLHEDRALPDLGANIKQGNALVEPDILGLDEFDAGTVVSETSPFSWTEEFPFLAAGKKFDVVIGNPPWGADVSEAERTYLRQRYRRVIKRIPDSYLYFIDKFLSLVKAAGYVGMVLPSTLLNQQDAILARDLFCENGVDCVVNLGQGVFGRKVLNTTAVVSCMAGSRPVKIETLDLSKVPQSEKQGGLQRLVSLPRQKWLETVRSDPEHTFFVGDFRAAQILAEVRSKNPRLSEILEGDIQRGVSPDLALAHVLSRADLQTEKPESECVRNSISGEQIKPYGRWEVDQGILYLGKGDDIDKYPKALKHVAKYRDEITCPEVKSRKHPWWALHRKRDPAIFESPKFIGLTTSRTVNLVYDEKKSLVVTDSMFVFKVKKTIDPNVVLAVLQSRPFLFFYRVANQGESRVIPQLKAAKLEPLPFPKLASSDAFAKRFAGLVAKAQEIVAVEAQSEKDKTALYSGFDSLLREIDLAVCDAYGLGPEDSEYISRWLAPTQTPART